MKNLYDFLTESSEHYKRAFVVIKPGFLDLSDTIINRFAESGWTVSQTTIKQLQAKEARDLYAVHKKKPFYKDLCKYMRSGLCRAFIFKKLTSDPFKEVEDIKKEIRDKYGKSEMENVLHSSDSLESLAKESRIFFNLL